MQSKQFLVLIHQQFGTCMNIFVYFQDDSITKATSGSSANVGEFNPFTTTEMVCWFKKFVSFILLLCKWLFC